jgi:hypothetical protein
MNDDHKKAISNANKGNKNSSITNRETNQYLKDILRRLVLVQDDGSKAYRIVNALINKAEEGDLRAIEIILDRLDGKAVQHLHANVDANYNRPIKVITGIKDSYDDEEDDDVIKVQFVEPKPRDAEGKLIKTDS